VARTTGIDLPPLYGQLGGHIENEGTLKDEFVNEHRGLSELKTRVESLATPSAVPPAGRFMAKVQAGLSKVWAKLQIVFLHRRIQRLRRRLGKRAFAEHKDEAGPALLISKINESVSRVDQLNQESQQLEEQYAGQLLTPSRVAIVSTVLFALLVCGVVWRGVATDSSRAPSISVADAGNDRDAGSLVEEPQSTGRTTKPDGADSPLRGEYDDFIEGDSFSRDVVNAIPLNRFLQENTEASLDRENSASAIGFKQYNESFFQYGFLDDKLISITMLLPRDRAGIEREFTKYQDAFGPASNTSIPAQMRANGATRHASWRLPDYDFEVSLTVQPSQSVGLVLVGFWRSMSRSDELLRRLDRDASGVASAEGPLGTGSADPSETTAVSDSLDRRLLREVTAQQAIERSLARLGRGDPLGLRSLLEAPRGSSREEILKQSLGDTNRDLVEALLGKGPEKALSSSAATIEMYRDAPRDSAGRLTDEGLESQELAALVLSGLMNGNKPEPSFRTIESVRRQLLVTSRFARVNNYIDNLARGSMADDKIETEMRSIEILATMEGRTPESTLDFLKKGVEAGNKLGLDPTLAIQSTKEALAASVIRKGEW